MPTLEGPCPPCKIILDGGFVAVLAPILTDRCGSDFPLTTAAFNLSVAAGITNRPAESATAITLMQDWTAETWSAIRDLADGKVPDVG